MGSLNVQDLSVDVVIDRDAVRVVDGVSMAVPGGSAVALVGESGAGKSLVARAIVGLLPPAARAAGGRVLIATNESGPLDLLAFDEAGQRRLRGARVGLLLQDPRTSFDPLRRVGDQVGAALRVHRGASSTMARAAAVRALVDLGLQPRHARAWPHELSSGELQRAALAAALIAEPDVLVADEPTSALDATVAADVLALLARERSRRGLAVLLVTHDLGVAAAHCDDVHVMVAGRVVESGPSGIVFDAPRHPFSRALFASSPARTLPGNALGTLAAPPASPHAWPSGCRFRDRCPDVDDVCCDEPPLVLLGDRTRVRCARIGTAR